MRYVSIDIETLGLYPDSCDVIEFGAVIDDLETPLDKLPRFHSYVTRPDNLYKGDAYAMSMHPVILRRIATREAGYTYTPWDLLSEVFDRWLDEQNMHDKIVVAGKNFMGFDMRFLRRLNFGKQVKISHRALDPGSMFFDPKIDKVPPSTDECYKRAGMDIPVAHTAVEDALGVVQLIRYFTKYRRFVFLSPPNLDKLDG